MKNTIYLLSFFLSFLVTTLFAKEKKLDKYPEPIGGIEAMIKNIIYPQTAKESGVEGKVLVKAIIDEKGTVIETSILKSVREDCNKAAMDVIIKTKFTPALKTTNL